MANDFVCLFLADIVYKCSGNLSIICNTTCLIKRWIKIQRHRQWGSSSRIILLHVGQDSYIFWQASTTKGSQQAAAKHSRREHILVNLLDEYVLVSIPLQFGHSLVTSRSRSSSYYISNDSDNDYII